MNDNRNIMLDNNNDVNNVNNNVSVPIDNINNDNYGMTQSPTVMPTGNEKKISGLALVGIILAFLLPPIGLIVSIMAKKEIEQNHEDGKTIAMIGLIVGILGTISIVLVLIIGLFYTKKVEPQIQNNLILSTACSNLDAKGNYSMENVECVNYVCTYNDNGKKETKDCKSRANYDGTKNIESEETEDEDTLSDDELVDLFG